MSSWIAMRICRWPLYLRVHHDVLRHLQVRVAIHEDMADALVMLDHGNLRAFRHGADQSLATARHAQVHEMREREKLLDGVAVCRRHDLDRVLRKFRQLFPRRAYHRLRDDLVRVNRLLAAAQDGRVAGLEAQARGVGGDVGTRL